MRRNRLVLLIIIGGLLVAGGVGLALPGVRLRLRANRVVYLANAHRYDDALLEHDRLRVDFPDARRLPADFDQQVIERAARYYRDRSRQGLDPGAYERLLDQAGRRPALAPLVRRKWLDLIAARDKASTRTLAAARAVLEHDGYDPDALWWAVIIQYNPARPLVIPPELLNPAWRRELEQTLLPAGQVGEEARRRSTYLRALAALADQNWAEAADLFDRFQPLTGRTGDPVDLAHGLALLKAGRPEAATVYLRQYRQAFPKGVNSLAWLAEAFLSIPDYPWAAQSVDELRTLDRAREAAILREAFGLADAGRDDPFLALCQAVAGDGPLGGDTRLWTWLAWLADTSARKQAVLTAGAALAGRGLAGAEAQARLIEYGLREGRPDLLHSLLASHLELDMPSSIAPAGEPKPVPSSVISMDAFRRQSLERIAAWAASSPSSATLTTATTLTSATQPRQALNVDRLLTRNRTERFALALPAGSAWVVIKVQGFDAHGAWPILRFDLGEWGARTVYAADSRVLERPFVLPLARFPDRAVTIQAAVSLLNGSESAVEDRGARVDDVFVF